MINIFVNTESCKDPTVTYLTGHSPSFCILFYDDDSKKRCMFVANFEVSMYPGVRCFPFSREGMRKKALGFFKRRKIDSVGFNYPYISISTSRKITKILGCKHKDISKKFQKLREVKSRKEIEKISEACNITDKIYSYLIDCKEAFKTEKDIYDFLLIKMQIMGVERSFDPVVATAANAAEPHHIADKSTLKGFTVIDFGVKFKGYCSDMTRMLFYGRPKSDDIDNYDKVINAYDTAFRELEYGCSLSKIDKVARDILGKRFIHSLGHGVGIEIHEMPTLTVNSKDKLMNNIIFTVEPGIYHKGSYGIRYENTIVFSNGKAKELTRSPKQLIIVNNLEKNKSKKKK
ncbi:M24 family metallopeptidase [Candidatus Woesearchaeota archaeon]|nr:M24 family metallopeptidase [Candidatus Woesearchaeota archaeon]